MATTVPGLEVKFEGPECACTPAQQCAFHAGAVTTTQREDLPAQWNCPYCNYGEYQNRDDWERRAADHIDQCPSKPQPVVTDTLMDEAWDLTTRDRHNQYGSAEDAFRAYGHVWTGLLQHKLRDGVVIDASDVCLMMTGLKLAREVRNSKRDNVVDAHGYLSLLSRIRGWVNRR